MKTSLLYSLTLNLIHLLIKAKLDYYPAVGFSLPITAIYCLPVNRKCMSDQVIFSYTRRQHSMFCAVRPT